MANIGVHSSKNFMIYMKHTKKANKERRVPVPTLPPGTSGGCRGGGGFTIIVIAA